MLHRIDKSVHRAVTGDAAALAMAMRVPKRFLTRDGFNTFDRATIDSAGVFMVGELERLDQTLNMPLVDVTWQRDIELREDVSMGDEVSSFTNSNFSAAQTIPGSNKSWVGKEANAIGGIGVDIGKTPQPLNLWALQIGWTIPELASAAQAGRPIDAQKFEGMQLKHQMDTDEQVYMGDTALALGGMFNHPSLTNVGNALTGGWSTATSDQMIADVQAIVASAWQASAFTVVPRNLLIAPLSFSILVSTKVSTAGNISVLEYLKANTLCNSVNGVPLDIKPCKWLTGTSNSGNGPATTDSMYAYTKRKKYIRFPMVPLQRTPLEYRDLRQLTTYFGRLGMVEVPYPETTALRSNLR